MIEIKTESGFVCQLADDANDDMELVEILSKKYNIEATRTSDLAQQLLGDQKKALYEHIRAIHGKVSIRAVEQEMQEILQAFGNSGKNS